MLESLNMGSIDRVKARNRRKKRIRKKIRGTPERPRLCVFRSYGHIYAQIIDDVSGRTLVEASTLSKDLRDEVGKDKGNKKGSHRIGAAVAHLALKQGIRTVVFDRNGYLYHGRVKALCEGARENGLNF